MLDKPSLQDLLEVQRYFDLPSPVLVEKDWHVVRALAAIAAADVKPFRLVFGGGTAPARRLPAGWMALSQRGRDKEGDLEVRDSFPHIR